MSIDRKCFSYPDIIIFGGDPMMIDFERDTMVNPGVLVDIFSNETEQNDLEEKFKCYQKIPSLREYIMIDSWSWYARIKRQQPNREWKSYEIQGPDGELSIREIGFTIPFKKIYSYTTIWHFNK
jgi:Uma2 family endonuclease